MRNNDFFEDKYGSFKIGLDNLVQIKQGIEDIGQYIKEMLNALKRRVSFEEYLELISKYIDKNILNIQKEEQLTYVSGICNFKISDNKETLEIVTDLYFKNCSDQWIKKTINGKTPISDFNDNAQKCELVKIQNEGMKLDVEPPVEEE